MSLQGKIGGQGGRKGDLIHLWPAELLQGISEARSPEGVSAYQIEPLHSELEAETDFRTAKSAAICNIFCLCNDDALTSFTMRRESIYLIGSKAWFMSF